MSLDIQVRTIGGGPLVDDYLRWDSRVAAFFAGSPFDVASYRSRIREVSSRFDPVGSVAITDAVQPLSDGAVSRLASIARGEGFFVTTGQQPGLFSGPLYTVHKALTAVALASRLEALLEVPVLALFWVASDDHDWEEANHVHLVDTSNALRRLALTGSPDPPRSMGRRRVDGSAAGALQELARILPPSEFTPDLLAGLEADYGEAASVAGAFRATAARLFQGLDMGLVDSQHPRVRELGAPILRRALEQAAAGEDQLAARTRQLEEAGYEAQVAVLPGSSQVFHEDEQHGRERLLRNGFSWVLRTSGRRLQDDELWALFDEDPARFSPNVTLRPVLESAIIPTVAYVAGPGELSYLAQTGSLFEAHGVGMPLVFPRVSVVLVEGKVAKVLGKFSLEVDEFHQPVHEIIGDVVREDVPTPVRDTLSRLRGLLESEYEELSASAQEVDATLSGPIRAARNESFRALSEVEKKIRQHVKLRQQTELEQIEKAAINLFPLGKPQERVLNVHQYLARYGDGLLADILATARAAVNSRLGPAGSSVPAPVSPTWHRAGLE